MSNPVDAMRKKIVESQAKEVEINRHLGYADDYEHGSMAVTMRWDEAQALVDRVLELEEAAMPFARLAINTRLYPSDYQTRKVETVNPPSAKQVRRLRRLLGLDVTP